MLQSIIKPCGPSDSPTFSLDPDCWEQEEKVNNEENEALIS
jgi:hypothetical protein